MTSVLLPTYNGERFIGRAIESVLWQSERELELIVIDDGSTDRTGALVRARAEQDPRVRYIKQANQGIQAALNAGLRLAQGDYVARIDDDDVWEDPLKLQKQLRYIEEHPDCVLVGTAMIIQDETGAELFRFQNPQTDAQIRRALLYRNCFSHSTVLFKRAAALKFGGYDEAEATRFAEDYDLWLKLGTIGSLANLPDHCVRFTVRSGSVSSTLSVANKIIQFTHQLAIAKIYRGNAAYGSYVTSRIKSYLRLWLYQAFGAIVPVSLQTRFLRWYKAI